jgi:ribosomal protein L12E/L44/L45/RPP1/RPP2
MPFLNVVGVEADSERVAKLLSELEGKDIAEVIAAGTEKLASVPSGGGGGAAAGGAAPAGDAAAAAKEEEKPAEEEEDAVSHVSSTVHLHICTLRQYANVLYFGRACRIWVSLCSTDRMRMLVKKCNTESAN